MNAHNQNLDTNGAAPVKPSIPMLAAEHLGTSYIQMLLQELKAAPDVWQKLSENQQHEIIERARQNAARSIAGAVNAIITNGHTALGGTIESVNIKDKIKLTVIVAKGNDTEALTELYQAGSEHPCQIMLGNAEQYLGGMDLIQADPNQPELFDPETPEDSLLWAINIPILSGNSVVPCPNRKDAETYARSIRNKFLLDDNEANHDYAKLVYAMPWTESPGAHNRSMAKGNWEAMLNWFSKLCRGEVVVEPIALLEFVPEAAPDYPVPAAEPVAKKDYSSIADLWTEAVKHVQKTKKVSTTSLQRKFGLGFERAALLVDAMEEMGVVSYAGASGKRDVLILEGVPALAIVTPVATEIVGDVVTDDFFPEAENLSDGESQERTELNDDIPEMLDSELDQEEPFTTPESVAIDQPTVAEHDLKDITITVRRPGSEFIAECLGYEGKSNVNPDIAINTLLRNMNMKLSAKVEITTDKDEVVRLRRYTATVYAIEADQE